MNDVEIVEPDISNAMLKRIEELQSLIDSVSEHHPYWRIAHYLLQALRSIAENWNRDVDEEELEKMKWYIEKISESLKQLRN